MTRGEWVTKVSTGGYFRRQNRQNAMNMRDITTLKKWTTFAKRMAGMGCDLNIIRSFACNLSCHYCSQTLGEKAPQDNTKPHGAAWWLDYVAAFPLRVIHVGLSGGEPTLITDTPQLINGLVGMGIPVTLVTNLMPDVDWSALPASYMLQVVATYHHASDMPTWVQHWNEAKRHGIRIHAREVCTRELPHTIRPHETIPLYTDAIRSKETDRGIIAAGPDGRLFRNCYDRGMAYTTVTESGEM